MARLPLTTIQQIRKKQAILIYTTWMRMILSFNFIFQLMYLSLLRSSRRTSRDRYTIYKLERTQYIHRLIHRHPASCVENFRMDKRSFYKLGFLLESRGYVQESKHTNVVEKVAMFLYILGSHTKMRGILSNFERSTQSISRFFHEVLNGVLRLQGDYFKKPEPIHNDSTDKKWKDFKSHVGALKWRNTPFPHFDDLSTIFGKDRATKVMYNASKMIADEFANSTKMMAAESLTWMF